MPAKIVRLSVFLLIPNQTIILENINPVVSMALKEAGVTLNDITAIGVTYGPGLVGALLVGVAMAKAIAFATSNASPAASSLVRPIISYFPYSSTITRCVCPPETTNAANGGFNKML